MEKWSICVDFPRYEISTLGKVRNLNGKVLKQFIHHYGYKCVCLRVRKNVRKTVTVHRLVAKAFVPGESIHKNEVDHINRVRNDSRVENLRWSTRKQNAKNRSPTKEDRKKRARASFETVKKVIELYKSGISEYEIYLML